MVIPSEGAVNHEVWEAVGGGIILSVTGLSKLKSQSCSTNQATRINRHSESIIRTLCFSTIDIFRRYVYLLHISGELEK